MNCLLIGAIVRIGGAQKRADGVADAKYSNIFSFTLRHLLWTREKCESKKCKKKYN